MYKPGHAELCIPGNTEDVSDVSERYEIMECSLEL